MLGITSTLVHAFDAASTANDIAVISLARPVAVNAVAPVKFDGTIPTPRTPLIMAGYGNIGTGNNCCNGGSTHAPAGKAMFQMMGVFAEFERAMIQERVRAGLARARSEGKRLGRPPIAPALEKRIREALATPGRPGIRVIAERG